MNRPLTRPFARLLPRLLPRRLSPLLLATAVVVTAACDEESVTLDSGADSDLTVRAFVDADGNGEFDSGSDVAINGATITVTRGDGSFTDAAETAGQGEATFVLPPGSYQIAFDGGVPAGAVLATARTPVVVAPFRAEQLEAEFRFTFEAGEISGRLFRDDNGDGDFDAGEDTPAAGVLISLFEGGADGGSAAPRQTGEPVATTTTASDGTFLFERVRPGTYTLVIEAPPSVTIVGGAEQTVVVDPGQATAIGVEFEGSFLIPISEARAASVGDPVTVEGTVTFAPDFNGDIAFIQDGTAGIVIFEGDGLGQLAGVDALTAGEVVRVTGERGDFFSEAQITAITSLEIVDAGPVPNPRLVTGDELAAGQFQGELVSNEGVVEQVDVLNFGNQLVSLRDAGGNTFTVFVDSRTGVEADTWVEGETFGVTGVVGIDTRNDPPFQQFQVEVRSPDDVQQGGNLVTVAEARASLGETVVTRAIVTFVTPDDRVIFFQDETGGMSTFDFSGNLPPLSRGDLIVIQGVVGSFRAEVQLSPVNDVQILGNVAVPAPLGVTGAQLDDGVGQGRLVVATGTVQEVEVLSFGNQSVTLLDPAGTEITVFVDSRVGVSADDWTEGETVRVTGVVGNDAPDGGADPTDPANIFPRIEVRGPEDLETGVSAGTFSVAEARSMPGETVTIEATVTRTPTFQPNVFAQDGTAGITVFSFDLPELAPGDRIRVTGEIGDFNGEVQIAVESIEVLDQVTVPAPLSVTGAQVNAGLFQGQLAQGTGTVVDVEVVNQFGTHEVSVRDDAGTVYRVFVDNRSGVSADDWTPGQSVTIIGVLGFFEGSDPGSQLEVIVEEDVTFGS